MIKKTTVLLATVSILLCVPAFSLEWTVFGNQATGGAPAIQSDDALAYLELDIENRPGLVASFKGGYQWQFYRKAGVKVGLKINF